MPTISVFFGIAIRMYFDDHEPPHFHAYYAEYSAKITIDTMEVLQGELPRRALAMVLEWAVAHRAELAPARRSATAREGAENWALARQHMELRKIEPLR